MPRLDAAARRRVPPSSVAYYSAEKTARILAKYGPGPRVHFHTGIFAREIPKTTSRDELRSAMVQAQEALVARVPVAKKRVLDVGCGLGGPAIWWTTELAANVTAITIVPEHVDLVRRFSREAGVNVEVLLRDAHDLAGMGAFDAVCAIESSCYFDRARWFAELRGVLPIGGLVHVIDCFAGRPSIAPRFDAYWCTRIGALEEYEEAAATAGFERVARSDLGGEALSFWSLSMRHSSLGLEVAEEGERARLSTSIREHRWLQESIACGDVRYVHVVFRRAR